MGLTADIAAIKDLAGKLDPSMKDEEEDHPAYRTAVVVLAAVAVGPRICELAALTGYDHDFVAVISERMRLAGLWSETQVKSDHWLAEDGDTIQPVVFLSDVLVAQGLLMAQPEGPIRVRYWPLEGNPKEWRRDADTSKPVLQ